MKILDFEVKAVVAFLSKEKIDYAILGGVAVSLYGEPRYTADLDVSIMLNKKSIKAFIKKTG